MIDQTRPTTKLSAIPRGVWALGFVSMLMDISSEMIHALLPLYLVVALGTSALTVGVIEGIAEATALITKVFSGALSDWLAKRKFLAALGYGIAALTKPIFPLATSIEWLMAARFVDRIGKGIRGAPRDALVADLSPADIRGASFGLRQSLDTVGAFLGPLIAIGLMWLTLNNFTRVFWFAVLPAILSFLLIVVAVKEPECPPGLRDRHAACTWLYAAALRGWRLRRTRSSPSRRSQGMSRLMGAMTTAPSRRLSPQRCGGAASSASARSMRRASRLLRRWRERRQQQRFPAAPNLQRARTCSRAPQVWRRLRCAACPRCSSPREWGVDGADIGTRKVACASGCGHLSTGVQLLFTQ
jgi:hypothetical protein